MHVVGLTGGIATGKSNISNVLKLQGAYVWDADEASRRVVEPGEKGYKAIKEKFGELLFDPDGTLNRERTAEYFFTDKARIDSLNAILHPIIIDDMIAQLKVWHNQGIKFCFLDAPLLFEAGVDKYCDEIWVASCGMDEQIRRVLARDEISYDDARKRIEVQMPDAEKRARASRIIDTSGDIADTNAFVKVLYEELKDEFD